MTPLSRGRLETAEAWIWTGPVGRLYGGLSDFVILLSRILWARARSWLGRPAGSR